MTLTSTVNRVSYDGDGSAVDFAVPYAFLDANDLEVIERNLTTGAETIKSLDNEFTISGGMGATGSVHAMLAPPIGVSWTIVRRTQRFQSIDYTDNDPFPAATHESGLDRVTMIVQDAAADVDRALRFPVTDSATIPDEIPNSGLRANKFLAFDSAGAPIASTGGISGSIPVSGFIQGVLDDIDAATARQSLGLVIGTDVAPAGATGDYVGKVDLTIRVTPPVGWIVLNGDSIGDTGSGATLADPQFEELFKEFWGAMADAQAPVSTGRGVSAQADWNAGKTLTMPDARQRLPIVAGAVGGLTARTLGDVGGVEAHTLTVDEMPGHDHNVDEWRSNDFDATGGSKFVMADTNGSQNLNVNKGMQPRGGDQPHNNMPPWIALNLIVKF